MYQTPTWTLWVNSNPDKPGPHGRVLGAGALANAAGPAGALQQVRLAGPDDLKQAFLEFEALLFINKCMCIYIYVFLCIS